MNKRAVKIGGSIVYWVNSIFGTRCRPLLPPAYHDTVYVNTPNQRPTGHCRISRRGVQL